jgi:Autographiviridae endonuclease
VFDRATIERFMRFVSPCPITGCWWWTGAVATMGVFWLDGRNVGAHRVAFALVHGRMPHEVTRHRCDMGLCVNPAHVTEGTQAENMADKVARARQARGPRVGTARLAEAQIVEIRSRYATGGETLDTLAAAFRIDRTNIWHVVHRKTWRHVA